MLVIVVTAVILMLLYIAMRKKNNTAHFFGNKSLDDPSLSSQADEKTSVNRQKTTMLGSKPNASENSDEFINVTAEGGGNTVTFTISLNEKEFIKRYNDGSIGKKTRSGEKAIDDIVGFYGTKVFSFNNEYCVISRDGYHTEDNWKNGEIALVKAQTLLFKKKLQRPHDCHVSNTGIVVCCDWLKTDGLHGKFLVFDSHGELLFSRKTSANIGNSGISEDGNIAIFETFNSETKDSDKIFIVDIVAKNIVNSFDRPCSFNDVHISAGSQRIDLIDNKGFHYEIDFEGKQTNTVEYETQILQKGAVYDKLQLYLSKSDEKKFKDTNYLAVLQSSLKDRDASSSFGDDKLYRMIGEYYYANNDIPLAMENWEKALEINPRVGIKKKLDNLKIRKS